MGACSSTSMPTSPTPLPLSSLASTRVTQISAEYAALRADIAASCAPSISADASHERVMKGFIRRDVEHQRHVFSRLAEISDNGRSALSLSKLPEALAAIYARAPSSSNTFDQDRDSVVDFPEFQVAAVAPGPLERWLLRLPLAQIISDAMPPEVSEAGYDEGMMHALADLPPSVALASLQAAVVGLMQAILQQQSLLRISLEQQRARVSSPHSKFQVMAMSAGTIDDFHRGLADRIGAPNLDFEQTMRLEHCDKSGCDVYFSASNYNVTTTPRKEWLYIVGGDNDEVGPPEEQMAFGRRIPSIKALMELPISIQSCLTRPEVIALILYTGPMFVVYNSILRRFPKETYSAFSSSGNLFSTTMFVLVSAVQKISTRMSLPLGTKLYRGMGGRFELPQSFLRPDERGCIGFTEWGFLSTTADLDVAFQYSGITSGKPLPAIMVITPSSVDRGACIELFSQYPSEKEFLYVPMSFLQPVGGPNDAYLVQSSHGFVCAYPVRINSNLKSETVEQLVSKKKDSHVASFAAAIDEVRHDIQAEATACNAAARLSRDRTRHQKDTGLGGVEGQGDWSVADVLGCIMKQCYVALERHKTLPPAEFVDEGMFRLLVTDLLNTKQFAKEKLRLWLHDDNQLVVFWSSYTLRDAHRLWLGLVRRRIKAAQSSRLDDAASAALLLLQVKGRVRSCVADCNLDGEPLFVEAGGDGWDEEDVTLFSSSILHLRANLPPQVLALAQAGCDLRAVNCMGHSGLSQAAAYGNTATLCAMLQVGADVAQYSPGKGMGALFRASYNGHVACVRALVQHKADMNAALADGTTCCYVAAEKGHSELLRFLIQSGAAVDKPDNNSVTPLWRAAERGVAECVEILINARANAEALDKDAKSALRAAACNGHDRIVELLQAAGAITGLDDEVGHSA